jgi:hypothetical protein
MGGFLVAFYVIPNGVHGRSPRVLSSRTFGTCQLAASTTAAPFELPALHDPIHDFKFPYVARPLRPVGVFLHLLI